MKNVEERSLSAICLLLLRGIYLISGEEEPRTTALKIYDHAKKGGAEPNKGAILAGMVVKPWEYFRAWSLFSEDCLNSSVCVFSYLFGGWNGRSFDRASFGMIARKIGLSEDQQEQFLVSIRRIHASNLGWPTMVDNRPCLISSKREWELEVTDDI